MSLSFWLRDYLYIPLGGNRGGALFVCRNLMITMLLGGLCHGAAWICVVWGALHSVGLCANKLWRDVRQRVPVAIKSHGGGPLGKRRTMRALGTVWQRRYNLEQWCG